MITPNLALLMTVALAAAENTTHHCVGRETGRPYRCFTWEVMTETCIRWEGMEASPIPCDYPCSTEYCASTHHYEVVCTVATCESPAGKDDSDNNGKISSWIKISSVGGLISMTTTAVLLTLLAIRLWLKRFAPAQYARLCLSQPDRVDGTAQGESGDEDAASQRSTSTSQSAAEAAAAAAQSPRSKEMTAYSNNPSSSSMMTPDDRAK